MKKYSLSEARSIVLNCAKQYANNLCYKSFIIIYRDRLDNQVKDIEVQFLPDNYQHLTGIEMIDANGNKRDHVADLFYKKCITNTLSNDEIQFKKDGTTHLKLAALPVIISIQKVTKITGDYNNQRTLLVADKLIGNINFCLGLKKKGSYYAPASALLENIKMLTNVQSQVLAVMSKNITEPIYKDIRHVAKGVDLTKVVLPEAVKKKINLDLYKYK